MRKYAFLFGVLWALFASGPQASAQTMYGTLGNFDAINGTGQTAHGFEIELDGCSPSDILSTFGAPYNPYGTPTITSSGGNTYVLYESPYDSIAHTWGVSTVSGTLAGTGGHSLYIGSGYPGFYPPGHNPPNIVPGDHFGVALRVNPTNEVYHWLVDSGKNDGSLVQFGSSVQIPAPVMSVVQPVPAQPPVVQVAVQAPPPEQGQLLGTAIWEKIIITTQENANPVQLNDLVLGNAALPPDPKSETEIDWQVLQAGNNQAANAKEHDDNLGAPAAGTESVTRRYEFYQYLGAFDPETHEAITEIPTLDPTSPSGYKEVGTFLGGQNVAADLVPVPEPSTLSLLACLGLAAAVVGCRKRSA